MESPPKRPGCPVIVILGAGASKDAGLRLAVELTQDLRDDVEGDIPLRQALGLILGGIAFRRGVDGQCIDGHIPDIETVVRIAQQLADRNNQLLSFYVASWHSALEKIAPGGEGVVFERLVQHARDILQEKLRTPSRATKYKYLADVWRLCQPLGLHVPPTVFTLNYDLCLENALEHDSKLFTTGFRDGIWTAAEFERTDCLHLYKLHGSFGWVRHPQTSVLYDRDRALRRHDIEIGGQDTVDELIFGTDNKLQAIQPFLWMVHRFSEAIERAKYIVAIGYGFQDRYSNQMVSYGMASDPLKRLIAVSPGANGTMIENSPGMNFYPARTDFIDQKAKVALDEQELIVAKIKDLESAAPAEDPFDDSR